MSATRDKIENVRVKTVFKEQNTAPQRRVDLLSERELGVTTRGKGSRTTHDRL